MAELRDKGIEIANEAVADDNAGRYEEAIQKYVKAAEWLLTATKYEKNPVTLKTLRDKCIEYTKRAEDLKKGLEATTKSRAGRPQSAGGGAGGNAAEDESDEDEPEPEPLTEEQLKAAEQEMEEELGKLVGMESVKKDMRRLCKELSLDLRRRQQGHKTLESIRHMMFTGNPGVGKTTVSRLVAKLYRQLGVSAKDHVVEVQKGDLVAGFVNQTAAKTAKHIKAARGGILFVDEAYQLTQAMSSGRHDFAGEAIDEMMKVMNDKGRKAVTFVFAGYKKEMDEFVQRGARVAHQVPLPLRRLHRRRARGHRQPQDEGHGLPDDGRCRLEPGRDHRQGHHRRAALQVQRPPHGQPAAVGVERDERAAAARRDGRPADHALQVGPREGELSPRSSRLRSPRHVA